MTKLREAVLLAMRLRGLSPRTNESYIHALEETGIDVALCPLCGKGHLFRAEKAVPAVCLRVQCSVLGILDF